MDYKALVVGDSVGLIWSNRACTGRISRITKTRIYVEYGVTNEQAFMLESGRATPWQSGFSSNNPSLVSVDEAKAKIKRLQQKRLEYCAKRIQREIESTFGTSCNVDERLREIQEYLLTQKGE